MNCSIVLDGYNSENNIKNIDKSFVIAVDGGIKHLKNRGIIPNVFIGDMDSIQEGYIDWAKEKKCEIITANREKNETDGQLAIEYAVDKGFNSIDFYFFDGGRPDHYLSNLFLLKYLLKNKIECRVYNNYGYYYPCNSKSSINCNIGDTISILPISKKIVLGECKGLKYSIHKGFIMNDDSPLGISNVAIDKNVNISVTQGECLIFVLDKNSI